MSDLNSYSFTGRLGADAETKYTAAGTAIWTARVAVGYGYGDNKGTNWLNVQVFGKRAEALSGLSLAKGAHIAVSGELRVREYDRKDGGKGTSVEVNAQDVALLGPKPAEAPFEGRGHKPSAKPQAARGERAAAEAEDTEDSIPF